MSSGGEVEAFLAAEWKSKTDESSAEADEREKENSRPNGYASGPQNPTKSPEPHQNVQQKEPDKTAGKEMEKKIIDGERSCTQATITSEGGASAGKNAKDDGTIVGLDGECNNEQENSELNINDGELPESDDDFTDSEEDDTTQKKDKYETGDVWGLLEQQQEDSEEEDEHNANGTLNSEDVKRMSVASESQVPDESETVVPKMIIPFSHFGKLLEQPGDASSPKLSNQGLANARAKMAEQGAQRDIKPKAASRKRSRSQTGAHRPTIEPDSTTKLRQTPPNPDAYFPINPTSRTQTAIIETNLNQRLLPHRGQEHNHYSEFVNSMVSQSTHTFDPMLGPSKMDDVTGMLPISRFKIHIDPMAQTILYNVLKYFENRKQMYDLRYEPLWVASRATGMSKSMARKIIVEARGKIQEGIKPFVENKARQLPRQTFSEPNVKRDCIARMFIHNSYLIKKEVPTLKKIIENCQQNGFENVLGITKSCVKAQLKKLGFEYSARSGSQKFLIERPDFIAQRIRYLEEMQEHREQNKHIVFVFIADMLKKGGKEMEWQGWDGIFEEEERGIDMGCVSVMHAAGPNFMYHNALQITETEVNSHVGLPREPFIQWLTTKLLPEVPKGSVIVLGNQRFHETTDAKKRPHIGCSKEQISSWLRQHNVASSQSWPKALLLERVQKVVLEQKYTIDEIITAQGHTPVHIPLHHRDLNPLSFLWQDIKDKLDKTPGTQHLRALKIFIKEEFTKAALKLAKAWIQVEKLEKSYYNIDMHTDDEKQELILKYGDGLVPIETKNDAGTQSSDDEDDPPNKVAKTI